MINLLYRLFLTLNSTFLLVVIYLIKSEITIEIPVPWVHVSPFYSYLGYISFPIILTIISILLIKYLDSDSIEISNGNSPIKFIEQANNQFLPSYLGYFFIALSIPNSGTLVLSYLIIFIFTFFSQALYYNPIFLLFGFNFYHVTTVNEIKVFILTKQTLKDPKETEFKSLKRINNFTFIDTFKL